MFLLRFMRRAVYLVLLLFALSSSFTIVSNVTAVEVYYSLSGEPIDKQANFHSLALETTAKKKWIKQSESTTYISNEESIHLYVF